VVITNLPQFFIFVPPFEQIILAIVEEQKKELPLDAF